MKSPVQIRRELAEGHWQLGEHRQAISCLRLALEAEPDDPALHELLERFLTEAEQGVASARNLEALTQLVHPPARAGSSATSPETTTWAPPGMCKGLTWLATQLFGMPSAKSPKPSAWS